MSFDEQAGGVACCEMADAMAQVGEGAVDVIQAGEECCQSGRG